MKVLVLSHDDVVDLLSVENCIPVMQDLFESLGRGEVFQPLRMPLPLPDLPGLMGFMPACLYGESPVLGLKAICVFPGNVVVGKDGHQGALLLFSAETGELKAVLNGSAITAIRTAAASGLAARYLSRPDAKQLSMVGAGAQATPQLKAILAVRDIEYVRVASLSRDKSQSFIDRFKSTHEGLNLHMEAADTTEEAVRDADIVVTVTTSAKPIVKGKWISPGTHLNVVGGSIPNVREVDSELMAAASLFVDSRESAENESGDYLFPLQEGVIGPDHIKAELGEVVAGSHPGRNSDSEITLFDSVGLGSEDVAAGAFIMAQAIKKNRGVWVDF